MKLNVKGALVLHPKLTPIVIGFGTLCSVALIGFATLCVAVVKTDITDDALSTSSYDLHYDDDLSLDGSHLKEGSNTEDSSDGDEGEGDE